MLEQPIFLARFARIFQFYLFSRQKLRGAVYDALEDLNVRPQDALFKPCFKKLFEICKIYSSDIPKNGPGTKKILAKVAKDHAEQVIKLAKALNSQ